LLSAALQDYPNGRVVLLIDNPPFPADPSDHRLLTAARALPETVMEFLQKPRAHIGDALRSFRDRATRGPIDIQRESRRLARLYEDVGAWLAEQGTDYSITDHADELFVAITFQEPARQYGEKASAWHDQAERSTWASPRLLMEEYRRLAA